MIKLSISDICQQLREMQRNAEIAENELDDLLYSVTEEILDNGDILYTLEVDSDVLNNYDIDEDELPF